MLQFGRNGADHQDVLRIIGYRLAAISGAVILVIGGSVRSSLPASAIPTPQPAASETARRLATIPTETVMTTTTPPPSAPLFGLLGVDSTHFAEERAASLKVVTLGVGWNNVEPQPGVFDRVYLASMNARIAAAVSAGFGVVLDPGIQYPPAWVLQLPGGARFVDQYGDVFRGASDSGNNVANTVTNPAVRAALGVYLAGLGARIDRGSLLAVRQGGGPYGELRYPGMNYNGHTNCWWAYDAATQASSPVPGWKPGTGTTAQAASFLATYNSNLDKLGAWLNAQFTADFATTNLVMLPGWGERPGDRAGIVASRLTISHDEWNQGLDWAGLLPSLPNRASSVAYTTYLDAPTFVGNTDPADYLAPLTVANGIREGGENTGNGNLSLLDLSLGRAKSLHFFIVNWMDEAQVVASTRGTRATGPTFSDLGRAWSRFG